MVHGVTRNESTTPDLLCRSGHRVSLVDCRPARAGRGWRVDEDTRIGGEKMNDQVAYYLWLVILFVAGWGTASIVKGRPLAVRLLCFAALVMIVLFVSRTFSIG